MKPIVVSVVVSFVLAGCFAQTSKVQHVGMRPDLAPDSKADYAAHIYSALPRSEILFRGAAGAAETAKNRCQ